MAAASCAEAVKTELREQASGHSSASDVESDSDSPTEVKGGGIRQNGRHSLDAAASHACVPPRPLFPQHKASSSSSDEDSESSQEDEAGNDEGGGGRGSSQQMSSGHTIELDPSGHKLRHKQKPLKR